MARLFGRKYKLTIDRTLVIEQLDIAFKIVKSITKEPNKGEVKVYGLSDDTRGKLEKQRNRLGSTSNPVKLELEVGYEGQTSVIFSGDVSTIYSRRAAADIVTTFASADGIAQVRTGRVSFGVKPGTKILDVAKQVVRKGGLSIGNLEKAFASATITDLGSTFPEGTVVDGSAYDELTRIADSAGFEVSIQNGVLQVKTKGHALDDEAVDLNDDTGLVDSPTVEVNQDPTKPSKGEKYVKAKSLLIPGLFPGRKVKLKSEGFNGEYEIAAIEYSGETFGQDWYADMKLRPTK